MALVKDTLISDIDAGTYNPLKTGLNTVLKTVFTSLFEIGVEDVPDVDGPNPAAMRDAIKVNAEARATEWAAQLSDKIALEVSGAISKSVGDAVDAFVKTATVSVTVPSGVAVATAGSAAAQTGATTAPGIGTGDPTSGSGGLS